jgi:hypothetical protein
MTYDEFKFRVWKKFKTMTRACRSIGMKYSHWNALRANIYYAETPQRQRELDELWARLDADEPLYDVTPEMIYRIRQFAHTLPRRGRDLAAMAGISEHRYYHVVRGATKSVRRGGFDKVWEVVQKNTAQACTIQNKG